MRTYLKILLLVILSALVLYPETAQRWKLNRASNPNAHATAALVAYLRTLPINNTLFLANMDIGGVIKSYGNAAIIVQPKFELPQARAQVEQYTKLLFDPNEKEFINWCLKNNIRYFIYSLGTADWSAQQEQLAQSNYSGKLLLPHIYSARYMADAKRLPSSSVAFKCEFAPNTLRNLVQLAVPSEFQELEQSFRIFRVISDDEIFLSSFDAEMALEAKANYQLDLAKKLAFKAFYSAPSQTTYQAFCLVFATFPEPPNLDFYLKDTIFSP